jgi:uncharacterized protein
LFALFVVGAILRATLGRLVGSGGTGIVFGLLAWFIAGSFAAAIIAGIIGFIVTMFADSIFSSSGSGGGWSSSSGGSSSSDSGSFSGGGGSFGGGGASGSW